ncbi:MAG: SUMF1/EgtB/PvdO family nonheme iron enzyme [Opitutaceae bacterium]|nr:SUMF1/EgtB/PvdO family nonheme iron enzyme [Opitutaceae bacterium]
MREGKSLWEAPVIASDDDVTLLLEQVEFSKTALRGLSERLGEMHPEMIEAVTEFEATAVDLERNARNVADQQRIDFGLKFNGGSAPVWSQEPKADASAKWLEALRTESAKIREAAPPVGITVPNPGPIKVEETPANEPRIGQPWTISDLRLSLMPIAPGTFDMGSASGGQAHERPVTRVTMSQSFWMGKTEVTQRQWQAIMGDNPSKHRGDNLPVGTVSWEMAMEFCRRLPERELAAGRLASGYVFTLPTEAQWEYVCRAGTTGDFAGDLDATGWYKQNSGKTPHEVGLKQPNAWGLHDMHGNLWEWCLDWWGEYPGGAVTDPTGPSAGKLRVRRGGAWGSSAMGSAWLPGDNCRSANRMANEPDGKFDFVGFRIALIPPATVADPATSPPSDESRQAADLAMRAESAAHGAGTQTALAKVVFFRPSKFGSALAKLKVERADVGQVGVLNNGTWFERDVPAGSMKLIITHSLMRDKAEVEFVFQPGRTYYIRCLPEGSSGMSTVPEISLVGEIDGQSAVAKLKQLLL